MVENRKHHATLGYAQEMQEKWLQLHLALMQHPQLSIPLQVTQLDVQLYPLFNNFHRMCSKGYTLCARMPTFQMKLFLLKL